MFVSIEFVLFCTGFRYLAILNPFEFSVMWQQQTYFNYMAPFLTPKFTLTVYFTFLIIIILKIRVIISTTCKSQPIHL